MYKKYSKNIRILANICVFALTLQSVAPCHAAMKKARSIAQTIGSTVKKQSEQFGAMFSRAVNSVGASAKAKLSEVSARIRNFDRAALFNTVLLKMESAGNRIRRITNCMASGTECSSADRVILIGTATFIFAALLVLAGSTLTVAARAELVEKAKQEEAQKAKGASPQSAAERLGNMIRHGKARFVSLKEGIITGKLTREERNFLIGLGASIIGTTIITAAVLTGLAMYSKQQEEKQAVEIARQQEKERQETEQPTTVTPPIPVPISPTEKPSSQSVLSRLKELAQETKLSIDEKITPMQEYFTQRVIPEGKNILQSAAATTKKLLEEKTRLAKEAIASTVSDKKEQLAQAASIAYEKAKALAQEVKTKIEQATPEFLKQALEQIMQVKLENIKPAIDKIMEYTQRSMRAWEPMYKVRLMDQLKKMSANITIFVDQVSKLSHNWSAALTELTNRATWIQSHIRPVALGGKSTEQINKEAAIKYPIASIFDQAWDFYPQLTKSVNDLKIGGPGIIIQTYLKLVALLMEAAASLNTSTGVIGKAIISPRLSASLLIVRQELLTLAENIRETSRIQPILKQFPQSTRGAFLEALKGYSWRVGFNLHTELIKRVDTIIDLYNNKITPLIDEINVQRLALMDSFYGIPANIKRGLLRGLSTQPVLTAAIAPYLLARFLGTNISNLKEQINEIINKSSELLIATAQLIEEVRPTAQLINTAMGGEVINTEIINNLDRIDTSIDIIQGELKSIKKGIQETLPTIPATSA